MKTRIALLLSTAAILAASSLTFAATRTFDFTTGYGTADEPCNNVPPRKPPMFNRPGYGYQTASYVDGSDACGAGALNTSLGTDSLLTDDYAASLPNCNEIRFSWTDPTDDKTWLRVPTYNAGGVTPTSPNPTVYLGVGSSISMKVMAFGTDGNLANEAWVETGQLELALCIRETGTNVPIGTDGGMTGTVEFVGIDSKGVTGDANTPVGGIVLNSSGAAPPGEFTTIKWTFVDVLPEGAPDGLIDGVDVTVTPPGGSPTVYHKSIIAFSGDGILSAANNRGTLDSLAIRKPEGDDLTKKWYVDIDDIVIDAPGVVDPVIPPQMPAAVLPTDTQVTISGIDFWTPATQVRLLRNHADFNPPVIADPGGSATYTFTGLTLAEGDVLTATQTVGGIESAESAPVEVTAVIFKDNFDSSANQAALDAAWPATCFQPVHVTLTSDFSASCQNSVLDPPTSSSAATVCGLLRQLDHYYDGTDAVPLTLTVWMYSSAGAGAVSWVELSSYSGAWGSTTLQQQLLIGMCPWTGYTPPLDPALYQARQAYGGMNWVNIDGVPRVSNAWVKLQIKVKTSTIEYLVNGVGISKPRGNNYGFNAVVIGSRQISSVPVYYDNICLSYGEPPLEPFGDPNPTPPPVLAAPILPQVTSVTVNGLDPAATQAKVYENGVLVGSASLSGQTSEAVTVSPLTCGATIQATQVKAGVESCYSVPVPVRNPLPTVPGPLTEGDTTVTVNNLSTAATLVKVYANNALIGSASLAGETTKAVPVTPLIAGQAVEAAQIINGIECGRSAPITINQPLLTGWTATSLLPVGTAEPVVLYLNGYMYCIGGRTTAGVIVDSVYYAAVNSDGSLGPWTATASMPSTCTTHAGAVYNGRIYVWGGWDNNGTVLASCFYAQPNPDGTISSWTTSAVTLPVAVDLIGNGVHAYQDNLYTINGANASGTALSTAYVSKLTGAGDFGPWQATASTPTPRKYLNTAVVETASGAYIYRVCGADLNYTAQPDTVKGTIAPDGTISSWTQQTATIPVSPATPIVTGLYDHAVAVADGRIFVVCGLDDTNAAQDLVFFTEVNPANGDIGSWKQEAHKYPMKIGRNAAVGYQVGSDWYILGVGGQVTGYSTRKRECYYAKLNTTSCIAPTVTAITPPNGRRDNAACHVTIEGTGFVSGATGVVLKKAGQGDIVGTNVTVAGDGNSLTCDFDLIGRPLGAWDVVVTTCAEATLAEGFEVKVPLPVVTSITPDHGVQDNGNREVNPGGAPLYTVSPPPLHVQIAGGNFVTGATVRLVQGSQTIPASNVVVVSASLITADIDLTGAAPGALDGAWDVVVSTDGDGTLPAGFAVSMCFSPPQDADGDGDVDLSDFGVFQGCFNGPNRPYKPAPVDQRKGACMDVGDNPIVNDIDLSDFNKFQGCFNGPNRPPKAGC